MSTDVSLPPAGSFPQPKPLTRQPALCDKSQNNTDFTIITNSDDIKPYICYGIMKFLLSKL